MSRSSVVLSRRYAAVLAAAAVLASLVAVPYAPAVAAEPRSDSSLSPTSIDTSSRAAVADSFQEGFLNPIEAHGANVGWTGNLASCNAGSISSRFSQMALSHINWFRQMVGSPQVSFDPALSAKAQKAALIMAANEQLTHNPGPTYECWSAEGQEGALNSNISLSFSWSFPIFLGDQVARYVADYGDNNTSVGHRNWILKPAPRPFGFGAVYTDTVASSAMWVSPTGTSSDRFIAWPTAGYVPQQVVFPRWNLAYDGAADFSQASVTMKWGSRNVPVEVISRAPGGGLSQIVWEVSDDVLPTGALLDCGDVSSFVLCSSFIDATEGDIAVDVVVSGIVIGGETITRRYRVTVFDPAVAGAGGGGGGGGGGGSDSTFTDTGNSVFGSDIEWLAESGITKGCNPPANSRFCPDDPVTRGQMATFLSRALSLPAAAGTFTDVASSPHRADIAALASSGITKGCNPPANTRFCPEDPVTRGQMASFLTRALSLPSAPSAFTDVAASNPHRADIAALAAAGITRGCNPPTNDRFCPDERVTRGQMAAFLRRALES